MTENTPPQSRRNRGSHALGETFQFADSAPFGSSQPVLERLRLVLFEESYEILTQLIRDGELLACLTHLLHLPLLCSRQLLLSENKQQGGLVGKRVDDVLEREE